MRKHALMSAALFLAGYGGASAGEPQRIQLEWDQLEQRIAGRKICFALPDGTYVEGKAIAVRADAFQVKVGKSSNPRSQPKGRHWVPRQSLSVLQVREDRKTGRLLGAAGAVAIGAAIVAAHDIDVYGGPAVIAVPAVVAGGLAGLGVAGYSIGKAFDKSVTEIRIVPAAP